MPYGGETGAPPVLPGADARLSTNKLYEMPRT